jgi:Asp-tRNA(Asn)/Glu-tRNA(Gln) amidotransferase A subunit family amidase
MANSAGYPAMSVPNGFTERRTPTAITLYARPFGEIGLLALTKAYQDATGFHEKRPNLDGDAPSTIV